MAVRHHGARTCQLVAEDVHVDVTRFHKLVGGEPLTCQLRLGCRDEKWVRFGDQLLELCRSFSRCRWRGPLSVTADDGRFQLFYGPAGTLRDLPQVGAGGHETDDDRVAEELQLWIDRCEIGRRPRVFGQDSGEFCRRFVHEATSHTERCISGDSCVSCLSIQETPWRYNEYSRGTTPR